MSFCVFCFFLLKSDPFLMSHFFSNFFHNICSPTLEMEQLFEIAANGIRLLFDCVVSNCRLDTIARPGNGNFPRHIAEYLDSKTRIDSSILQSELNDSISTTHTLIQRLSNGIENKDEELKRLMSDFTVLKNERDEAWSLARSSVRKISYER